MVYEGIRAEDIRQGCKAYHQYEFAYDKAYVSYIADKNQDKWANPDRLDCNEVKRVVRFANQWKSRVPKNDETIRRLLNNLKTEVPRLNTLQSATLLDVKLDEATKQMIKECFDTITRSPVRNDGVTRVRRPVGTSKMLHAAINDKLFVAWDEKIQEGYIGHIVRSLRIDIVSNAGVLYAGAFLPMMQEIAKQAVSEVMNQENLPYEDAIQSFTDHCENNNSLAKIIDEYNYARFTAGML